MRHVACCSSCGTKHVCVWGANVYEKLLFIDRLSWSATHLQDTDTQMKCKSKAKKKRKDKNKAKAQAQVLCVSLRYKIQDAVQQSWLRIVVVVVDVVVVVVAGQQWDRQTDGFCFAPFAENTKVGSSCCHRMEQQIRFSHFERQQSWVYRYIYKYVCMYLYLCIFFAHSKEANVEKATHKI